jgi:hypothetical protein
LNSERKGKWCEMLQTTTQHSFQTMLKELIDVAGPPSSEHAVRKLMEKWTKPWADEITSDRLGSFSDARCSFG